MQTMWFSQGLLDGAESMPSVKQNIHLFLQFYIDKNPQRQKEILFCLRDNLSNPCIDKVHLLNERIYSLKEMGLAADTDADKLCQVNWGRRVQYKDFFEYIQQNQIEGYCVIANSDIVFDSTLANLWKVAKTEPWMLALLRYEVQTIHYSKWAAGDKSKQSVMFGPRYDSQDVWIMHSNSIPKSEWNRVFAFEMGKPGCDNKLIYLFGALLGYDVINDPISVRSYHIHGSQQRNYTSRDILPRPYGLIVPFGIDRRQMHDSLGMNWQAPWLQEMRPLRESNRFLLQSFQDMQNPFPVVVFRYSTILAMYATYTKMATMTTDRSVSKYLLDSLSDSTRLFREKGLTLANTRDLYFFSESYLSLFETKDACCLVVAAGEDVGKRDMQGTDMCREFMNSCWSPQKIWNGALESWHLLSLREEPWTWALKGKRLCFLSNNADVLLSQFTKRDKVFPQHDWFPECTAIGLSGPKPNGESLEAIIHAYEVEELEPQLSHFDVALISAGGYGPLILGYLAKKAKSAIDMGSRLNSFLGVVEKRYLQDRPDALRRYMNRDWVVVH
jgi:hypothetical protein